MLRRASVWDIENERVDRDQFYLVVAMRFYPRFLKREKVDEYVRALAPSSELFTEFKAKQRKSDNHNSSFYLVNYEQRFDLSAEGLEQLAEVSKLSREREVALVCQCRDFDRCHCDLLLLWARHSFGADVSGLIFDYPIFQKRLADGDVRKP